MNGNIEKPAVLRLIRLALFAGVAIFGSVVFYLTREGSFGDMPAETTRFLSFALIGLSAASLGTLLIIRALRERATDWERTASLTVVGWALGEAPALFGGVIYLLTASAVPYLTGVGILIVAFLLIPIPEES